MKIPYHIKNFEKVGRQLGSNSGGVYKDKEGNKYYIKLSKSNHHAINETLASKLYQAAKTPVIDTNIIDLGDNKLGTISKWQEHHKVFNPNDKNDVAEARKNFGTHAWLSNWDAIGLENDNQIRLNNNKLYTVDTGGALEFRAQGDPKGNLFGPQVKEFNTMRDANMSPNAAAVFKGMKPNELRNSATGVANVDDNTIHNLTKKYSKDSNHAANLAKTLIDRKKYLLHKVGWWDDLNKERKQDYIKEHPKTKKTLAKLKIQAALQKLVVADNTTKPVENPLHERVYNNLTSVGLKREKSKQDKTTGVWTHVFRKHTKFNSDNGNNLKTYMQRDGFTHEKTPLGHIFKQAGHHVELKSGVGGMKATYTHKDPSK